MPNLQTPFSASQFKAQRENTDLSLAKRPRDVVHPESLLQAWESTLDKATFDIEQYTTLGQMASHLGDKFPYVVVRTSSALPGFSYKGQSILVDQASACVDALLRNAFDVRALVGASNYCGLDAREYKGMLDSCHQRVMSLPVEDGSSEMVLRLRQTLDILLASARKVVASDVYAHVPPTPSYDRPAFIGSPDPSELPDLASLLDVNGLHARL